jgi:cytoskeletal protein CcmA (bactofilin family)
VSTACIGKSIHVKGTITSDEPLTIAGRVEGSITVNGHALNITQDGNVKADAGADTILIEGTANGRLTATTRIVLHAAATVVGEIVAPALSVAEGATVNARIDTGSRKGSAAKAGAGANGSAASVPGMKIA